MLTFAIANEKGGAGKTATTLGLLDAFLSLGRRCLLVDADPQANATRAVGIEVTDDMFTLNDVLYAGGEAVAPGSAAAAAVPASADWPSLSVVAAEKRLGQREEDTMMGRESRLRTALKGLDDQFDLVLIDCRPSAGQLTINAFVAADYVVLVGAPNADAAGGLATSLDTLMSVKSYYNDRLQIGGVLINGVTGVGGDKAAWRHTIETDYGTAILPDVIPQREAVARARTDQRRISSYRSPGAREVAAAMITNAQALLTKETKT